MIDSENAVDELVDAVPNVNLGDMLVRAAVQSFFTPQMTGYQDTMTMTPNGPVPGTPMPTFGRSPIAQVVDKLVQRYGERIRDAVITGIDLDDLTTRVADAVAKRIVDELAKEEPPTGYGYRRAGKVSAEAINEAVRAKVAERLSEREMAAYDARQAEMQEAWLRDQQRQQAEREQAQLLTGETAAPAEGA